MKRERRNKRSISTIVQLGARHPAPSIADNARQARKSAECDESPQPEISTDNPY
jgi:hypothetical protein